MTGSGAGLHVRDIREDEAGAYIPGATLLNDFSGRDFQRREMQVNPGPVLVTPLEVPDTRESAVRATNNGEAWSEGSTSVKSGTGGRGCGFELNRWGQPGDLMELETERIGALRNRVMQRSGPHA